MAFRKPQIKKPRTCPVQLALFALEERANPLDIEMGDLDPAPTALDLNWVFRGIVMAITKCS